MIRALSTLALPALLLLPSAPAAGERDGQASEQVEGVTFAKCQGRGRVTCVVDGDTFWLNGTKIRVADIDTPETARPGCAAERTLGERATVRFTALLNEGGFTLTGSGQDRYGRELRVVERDGASVGAALVREGLAEEWGGPRIAWCG